MMVRYCTIGERAKQGRVGEKAIWVESIQEGEKRVQAGWRTGSARRPFLAYYLLSEYQDTHMT